VSLVLSFRPEKKEPRREGSKKTWRRASDGSFFLFTRILSPPSKDQKERLHGGDWSLSGGVPGGECRENNYCR
ncbi:MAG: hypothetical protein AB7E51_17330, partial [Pseudodesulfovibrio sp.]|uniref:hypothetical protein n=1 Tax=Pseudodesulfovibrio sp. TaxID=2035812 RepID=UPI003D0AA665